MILVIDNYDSFVHNLARYVRELGEEAIVERADALSVAPGPKPKGNSIAEARAAASEAF